jgi:hypothetical protein
MFFFGKSQRMYLQTFQKRTPNPTKNSIPISVMAMKRSAEIMENMMLIPFQL